MKKDNFIGTGIVVSLATCIGFMYLTKIKSIILGVDIPSYFIFASVLAICTIMLFSKNDILDFLTMSTNKNDNKKETPDIIYDFCKAYYLKSTKEAANFVRLNVKNKDLANFFVRYLDKNNKEEIYEYICAQESLINKKANNARKIVYYFNFFVMLGTLASYIYDSNIKGILFISGILCLANLVFYRKIEKNIIDVKENIVLYKNIYEDILNFRNAKYIMYKCKNILNIHDDFVTIDNLEVDENLVDVEFTTIEDKPSIANDLNIEARKSAVVTIFNRKNRNSNKYNIKKQIKL